MNLRKIFNVPNENQKKLIEQDYKRMEKIAQKMANEHDVMESEYQENHDGKCPNCGATKIVNKIARTQGSGSVSGSFALGFGSIDGSSSSDTNSVNHCNECGNQWKKYQPNYKWTTDIFKEWMKHIIQYFDGEQWNWIEKTMKLLQEHNPYAETMYMILNEINCDLYRSDNLGLMRLRKLYKSVYDKN